MRQEKIAEPKTYYSEFWGARLKNGEAWSRGLYNYHRIFGPVALSSDFQFGDESAWIINGAIVHHEE